MVVVTLSKHKNKEKFQKRFCVQFCREKCLAFYFSAQKERLFKIVQKWKQPKYPSGDEWINKPWSIHTKEYYSTMKRNEALTQATTQAILEIIMLRGWSQIQKATYCVIPLI